MTDLASHYLEEIKRQFRGHKRMGEAAMAQLEDMDFFVTLDPESNSVAALVKHIAGNARSRFTDFLTSDGEKPDRFRDQEFEVSAKTTREEVLRWWEQAWSHVFSALDALQPEDVQRTVTIRQEPHTVMQRSTARSPTTRNTSDKLSSSPNTCALNNGRRLAFLGANPKTTRPRARKRILAERTKRRRDLESVACRSNHREQSISGIRRIGNAVSVE